MRASPTFHFYDPVTMAQDPESISADVAIVGAGPIGIEMAVSLRRAGIDYVHLEAKQVGYTISWFAPQTRFFSTNERIAIAGVPLQTPDGSKSTREQYLTYLRAVVEQFDLQINTYEPVTGIERHPGGGFGLTTRSLAGPRRYRCRRLILATGGTDRPRMLNVPGEGLPHVSHYFTDPHLYFRKRLLIVGGKNSAVEAALRCHNAGARVAVSYRRDKLPAKSIKYWLLPEINSLIATGRIEAYFNTVPTWIEPGRVTLRQYRDPAELFAGTSVATSQTREVPADFVLALIGYEQDDTLFRLAGVELRGDCHAPIFDERTMETSVPELYVIGTAVGGTQDKYTVFIENCHVHVARVIAALTHSPVVPVPAEPAGPPES
jgi:thioredoxin reductase (NADPH)